MPPTGGRCHPPDAAVRGAVPALSPERRGQEPAWQGPAGAKARWRRRRPLGAGPLSTAHREAVVEGDAAAMPSVTVDGDLGCIVPVTAGSMRCLRPAHGFPPDRLTRRGPPRRRYAGRCVESTRPGRQGRGFPRVPGAQRGGRTSVPSRAGPCTLDRQRRGRTVRAGRGTPISPGPPHRSLRENPPSGRAAHTGDVHADGPPDRPPRALRRRRVLGGATPEPTGSDEKEWWPW